MREVLQVGAFDEDDLYLALEHLAEHQSEIEDRLQARRAASDPGAMYLYDVTSHYLEEL